MKNPAETTLGRPRIETPLVQLSGGVPEETRAYLQKIADTLYEGNIAFVMRMALKDWCITDKKTRKW